MILPSVINISVLEHLSRHKIGFLLFNVVIDHDGLDGVFPTRKGDRWVLIKLHPSKCPHKQILLRLRWICT